MIQSLLIANRGDVACRVIRTAQQMGIRTIAVYSSCDRHALHVKKADEAYWIGDSPSSESYLNSEAIIQAAKEAQVDAIHPGYGFLSESAFFAKACLDAGFIFVGPTPAIIDLMADKKAAKKEVERLGIPTLPGYRGIIPEDKESREKLVTDIGLPVLIKAASGGGGKGMRLVRKLTELDQSITEARREAYSSFGDDSLMIERYLPDARHVEVQIVGDKYGNAIHLFDRECSVQRRHQKLIEEAPSLCDSSLRNTLFKDSVHLAKSISYHTLGTVEFLIDTNNQHYFIEMNTRLQVEHPVTEMITGIDCVALQLRLASGETLPYLQSDITQTGHAFELRLCAEDPLQSFLPAVGCIAGMDYPENISKLRIDTGYISGDRVSPYYDSMLAKWIVHDRSREEAISNLKESLNHLFLRGLNTNRNYLATLIQDPSFKQGNYTTQLVANTLDRYLNRLSHVPEEAQLLMLAARSLSKDHHPSPWRLNDSWRPGQKKQNTAIWKINGIECSLRWLGSFDSIMHVTISGHVYQCSAYWENDTTICIEMNARIIKASVKSFHSENLITYQGQQYTLCLLSTSDELSDKQSESQLRSPMPGSVTSISIEEGCRVQSGDILATVEAMKMEYPIKASIDGIIRSLHCSIGDSVKEGDILIEIE